MLRQPTKRVGINKKRLRNKFMREDVQAYAPDLFQVHNWDAQRFTAIKIWFKNAFNVVLASDVLSYKERILTIHCF